jgi:predicted lipoprotein with Yx(FWY)xxD motif
MTAAGLAVAGCSGEPSTRENTASRESTTSGAASENASQPTSTASATASSSTAGSARGLAITTAASEFGSMLFDRNGQAIYLFDKETKLRPQCYGACANAWPPVLTLGHPRAAGAVRETLLGTTERTDGSSQVTYAGHPLYYYAHEDPHQVLCHNVTEFGGRWLVVTPDGTPAT